MIRLQHPTSRPPTVTDVADEDLVTSALAGLSDAFDTLVSRHHAGIFNLAFHYTRNHEEASDLAQVVFMRAYQHLRSFRRERSFSRWILTIARNAALDALRRRRRPETIDLQQPTLLPGPEDVLIARDDACRVRAAVDALPERFRAAITLHYFGGLNYRESAETLGVPLGTIKTLISRGKRRIHKSLIQTADFSYERSA
jgi:RNA polymerase sigma-70 factor (ECF subfamily)